MIVKVSAFITREAANNLELLLFRHPHAGIQIPSGTVNRGEGIEAAVFREVREETGSKTFFGSHYLGSQDEHLTDQQRIITDYTKVYARPEKSSFDWAFLRPGITVELMRDENGYTQIQYVEYNQVPNPEYISMSILGWIPTNLLSDLIRRHFFHLKITGDSEDQWKINADNHTFTLFWSPLNLLPKIIHPQDTWLPHLGLPYKIRS